MRLVTRADGADLGNRHLELGQHFEQEGLERLVGAVDLVDEEHRCSILGDRLEQRPLQQKLLAEDLGFALGQRAAAAFAQAGAQHLPGIVPLVERRHRVETLVALQPDEARVEHVGEHLGAFGLADAGRALDQQRLVERQDELKGGGKRGVRDELALAEPGADRLGLHYVWGARYCAGDWTKSARQCGQQK